MKKFVLSTSLVLFFGFLYAQTNLSQDVLAAGGGVSKTSEIELQWTIGESVVGLASTSNRLYTVGFDQPVLISSKVIRDFAIDVTSQISVYPNPVENTLRVHFHEGKNDNVKMILSDLHGRALVEKAVSSKLSLTEISVQHLISGVYQLRILSMDGTILKTFKIIKAN